MLLDPIIADTGWSEAALAGAFGVSMLVGGVGSVAGGLLIDRHGSRLVFFLGAAVVLIAFQAAASASSPGAFALAVAAGGGAMSALGFYHVTQTAAVRIAPRSAARAIAILTIWGAFASALYLPAAAWLVERWGWRTTLRALTLSAAAALLVGGLFIDTRASSMPDRRHLVSELRGSFGSDAARRFILATGLLGIGVGTILVYQVPAMTSAGLPLAAASFWAGFRGFSQLGGRLPLMPIVRRLGVVGAYRLAIVATSAGAVVLAVAGTPVLALLFALLVGFGVGASSPLQGMHASELFGHSSLGTAMGALAMVFSVVGALGPIVAGWIAEVTGSRALPVAMAAAVTLGAMPLIRRTAQVNR